MVVVEFAVLMLVVIVRTAYSAGVGCSRRDVRAATLVFTV